MMKNIPVPRLILYLVCVGLIPFICVLFLFISKLNHLEELENSLESIQHEALVKEKKQALNLAVRQHFRDADHFYIDKYIESIVLLENEIDTLQKILTDKNFAEDDRIKKRLEYLTTQSNALVFSEGVVQNFPMFQETIETLLHPVEVNGTDIQKILARIEGVEIDGEEPGPNRPQLIITEFKLDKKKVSDKSEVFTLNMKLIKREFL
jgi:hypothetical protein